ncbi:unnamed protein product [Rangifer tarandus platyrhynchus]|uniref:Uncharacterized protein n=2 Tax=Rangifer tarandus platyrhynchus TaxID=3082113 RepID=A0ACB0E564_RANTA|nr:unnamed protein product [Rangifer tarandus platyrhynchus]CAI9695436.1 unnamed protein product [Rangifer tarandus platyrhynchus]
MRSACPGPVGWYSACAIPPGGRGTRTGSAAGACAATRVGGARAAPAQSSAVVGGRTRGGPGGGGAVREAGPGWAGLGRADGAAGLAAALRPDSTDSGRATGRARRPAPARGASERARRRRRRAVRACSGPPQHERRPARLFTSAPPARPGPGGPADPGGPRLRRPLPGPPARRAPALAAPGPRSLPRGALPSRPRSGRGHRSTAPGRRYSGPPSPGWLPGFGPPAGSASAGRAPPSLHPHLRPVLCWRRQPGADGGSLILHTRFMASG